MDFNLYPKQKKAIESCNARINLLEGSVRSGKTHGSYEWWVRYLLFNAPKGDLLMTGKTMTTLERNVLLPISDYVQDERLFKYSTSNKKATLFGKRIHLEGANDKKAEGKIRGMTIAGHYGDEVTLWPESYFVQSLARMSVGGAKFIGTTNPDGPYHWLKKDWIDADKGVHTEKLTIEDNIHLDPQFVASLKREYTGLWYSRYIKGLWVKAEGAVYDMFDEKTHVVKEIDYSNIVRYWVGVDYGTVNPTVFYLLGQHKDGTIYVMKEYRWDSKEKGRQKTDSQYAKDFIRWIGKVNYSAIYIDPSAVSFALELRNQGVKRVHKADNTVIDGIRNVSTLLSNDLLKIHSSCEGLIKEMSSYVWDETAAEKGVDKPIKDSDHGPDAIRYPIRMIFSRYCKPYLRNIAA